MSRARSRSSARRMSMAQDSFGGNLDFINGTKSPTYKSSKVTITSSEKPAKYKSSYSSYSTKTSSSKQHPDDDDEGERNSRSSSKASKTTTTTTTTKKYSTRVGPSSVSDKNPSNKNELDDATTTAFQKMLAGSTSGKRPSIIEFNHNKRPSLLNSNELNTNNPHEKKRRTSIFQNPHKEEKHKTNPSTSSGSTFRNSISVSNSGSNGGSHHARTGSSLITPRRDSQVTEDPRRSLRRSFAVNKKNSICGRDKALGRRDLSAQEKVFLRSGTPAVGSSIPQPKSMKSNFHNRRQSTSTRTTSYSTKGGSHRNRNENASIMDALRSSNFRDKDGTFGGGSKKTTTTTTITRSSNSKPSGSSRTSTTSSRRSSVAGGGNNHRTFGNIGNSSTTTVTRRTSTAGGNSHRHGRTASLMGGRGETRVTSTAKQSKLEESLTQEIKALEQANEQREKELQRKFQQRENELQDAISREINAYKQVAAKETQELQRVHRLKVEQLERVSESQDAEIKKLQRLNKLREQELDQVTKAQEQEISRLQRISKERELEFEQISRRQESEIEELKEIVGSREEELSRFAEQAEHFTQQQENLNEEQHYEFTQKIQMLQRESDEKGDEIRILKSMISQMSDSQPKVPSMGSDEGSLKIGDVVLLCSGDVVIIRYVGSVHWDDSSEEYVGVELSHQMGTCNGTYEGHFYFDTDELFGAFFKVEDVQKKIPAEFLLRKLNELSNLIQEQHEMENEMMHQDEMEIENEMLHQGLQSVPEEFNSPEREYRMERGSFNHDHGTTTIKTIHETKVYREVEPQNPQLLKLQRLDPDKLSDSQDGGGSVSRESADSYEV